MHVGARLATFATDGLRARDALAELIDVRGISLLAIDRMYEEYPKGLAPSALETARRKIRATDAFDQYLV
jgi:hypothetical protein